MTAASVFHSKLIPPKPAGRISTCTPLVIPSSDNYQRPEQQRPRASPRLVFLESRSASQIRAHQSSTKSYFHFGHATRTCIEYQFEALRGIHGHLPPESHPTLDLGHPQGKAVSDKAPVFRRFEVTSARAAMVAQNPSLAPGFPLARE